MLEEEEGRDKEARREEKKRQLKAEDDSQLRSKSKDATKPTSKNDGIYR